MSFGTMLLRVLLVVALLANGTGGALAFPASAETGSHHAMTGQACHPHASMPHARLTSAEVKGHATHHPACCTSGHCRCDGVSPLPGIVVTDGLPAVFERSSQNVPTVVLTRTDPALAHLIRPPIGQAVFRRL